MIFKKTINAVAVALAAAATMGLASCSDDCPDYWADHYGEFKFNDKPRFIWVDAAANSFYVLNNKEGIKEYVTKARNAGFCDLVVDVRGSSGDVLFKTDLVDQADGFWQWKRDAATMTSSYEYCTNEKQFDYLRAWIDECHAQGVRVHAAMNTFVGGYKNESKGIEIGMVYRDEAKKDWVTSINVADGTGYTGGIYKLTEAPSYKQGEIFLNPHHPEVQDFIVGLVSDLATNYPDLDGIILDRGRFLDCRSDFSDLTRAKFEEYIGTKIMRWPAQVFPAKTETVPTKNFPKYYKNWWVFRAQTIHDIIAKAAETVHAKSSSIKFGCYVGAWYGSYYQNGVNWASPNYDVTNIAGYADWASPEYPATGYADHIDILILGCYAGPTAVEGTNDWTVGGFAANGMKRTMGSCPLVIGGPDFGSWPTENNNYVFADKTQTAEFYHEAATKTVNACINNCDGYFLFDIIHMENSPQYWTDVKSGIDAYFDQHGADHYYEDNK